MGGPLHTGKQDDVPVLLGQDLERTGLVIVTLGGLLTPAPNLGDLCNILTFIQSEDYRFNFFIPRIK